MNSFSQQIKKSNTDEWYTTRDGVELIIPFIKDKNYKYILCPFDTEESNFTIVLREHGFEVDCSHIVTGTNFFDIDYFKDYDAIVSNPPFSKRQKVFEKLFDSKVPFAMITNFNGLFDSKSRWELFRSNSFELLIPCGRLHFFNENINGNSPNFQSIYVCKDMLPKQIYFTKGDEGKYQLW